MRHCKSLTRVWTLRIAQDGRVGAGEVPTKRTLMTSILNLLYIHFKSLGTSQINLLNLRWRFQF